MERYTVRAAARPPALTGRGDSRAWSGADELRVALFHPHSTAHRPQTRVRLLHDESGLFLRFRVRDRYVRSVQTKYQSMVCTDSCVEFFAQPREGAGYFNFEFNAGGTLLVYYIEDAARTPKGFRRFTKLPCALGRRVEIRHSLPAVVEPEIAAPVSWCVEAHIPRAVFEGVLGPLGRFRGQRWRANFYKCGDGTSHPHWASWAPLRNGQLNFHQPQFFGQLRFA